MINSKIKDFTDLTTWQESHKFVISIYKITKTFPKEEIYSLVDQMRRSAISVTSNIAEGFGRQTYPDRIHFYYIAQGSLIEVKNQIIISKDVGYTNLKDFENLMAEADLAHKLLQGLITKSKSFITPNS